MQSTLFCADRADASGKPVRLARYHLRQVFDLTRFALPARGGSFLAKMVFTVTINTQADDQSGRQQWPFAHSRLVSMQEVSRTSGVLGQDAAGGWQLDRFNLGGSEAHEAGLSPLSQMSLCQAWLDWKRALTSTFQTRINTNAQ